MNITLFVYPSSNGYTIFSNLSEVNELLNKKSVNECIAIIRKNYPNTLITIEYYNELNQLTKTTNYF